MDSTILEQTGVVPYSAKHGNSTFTITKSNMRHMDGSTRSPTTLIMAEVINRESVRPYASKIIPGGDVVAVWSSRRICQRWVVRGRHSPCRARLRLFAQSGKCALRPNFVTGTDCSQSHSYPGGIFYNRLPVDSGRNCFPRLGDERLLGRRKPRSNFVTSMIVMQLVDLLFPEL